MIGVIFLVKAELGMPAAGIYIALLAGLTALLFAGPGRFSVDRWNGIEPVKTDSTALAHSTLPLPA